MRMQNRFNEEKNWTRMIHEPLMNRVEENTRKPRPTPIWIQGKSTALRIWYRLWLIPPPFEPKIPQPKHPFELEVTQSITTFITTSLYSFHSLIQWRRRQPNGFFLWFNVCFRVCVKVMLTNERIEWDIVGSRLRKRGKQRPLHVFKILAMYLDSFGYQSCVQFI